MNVPELVQALVNTNRQATDSELQQLINHVVRVPFSSRRLKINRWLRRELENRGVQIPSEKSPSVEIHLLKRIYLDQQWPPETTVDDFVTDLHQAIQHREVQVWTYRWFGETFLGFLAPSHVQNVPNAETFIFVAYSADYDVIKTGFQASSPTAIFTTEFENLTRHK